MKNQDKTMSFIQRANLIHNNKYDYSKVDYVNSYTKVCIICPEHGEFWQQPRKHLAGQGCTKCKNLYHYSSDEYITKVNNIHNGKYDYAEAVLNDIIYNDSPIGLGKSRINQYIKFNLSEKDVHNLEEFKSQLISKSYKDFDNELLKLNYIIYDDKDCKTQSNNQNLTSLWTNIFKGVYSGYVNGLSSKNKGNAFEKYFYDKSQSEIASNLGYSQAKVSREEKKILVKLKNYYKV